jgi:hypothetical protein
MAADYQAATEGSIARRSSTIPINMILWQRHHVRSWGPTGSRISGPSGRLLTQTRRPQTALDCDQSPLPPRLFPGDILVEPIEFAHIGCRNWTDMVAQLHNIAALVNWPVWQTRAIGIAGGRKIYKVG